MKNALVCLIVISLSQWVVTLSAKNHDILPLHLNSTVTPNVTATINQTTSGNVSTNSSTAPTAGSVNSSQTNSTGANSAAAI